jgi:integrase
MSIPLSRQALSLLEEIKAAELSRRQLEGNGDDIALGDMVFVGQKGGKLDNWDRWLKANFKKSGVDGWSAHALRRTTATLAGGTGAAPHVVSVILGHANLGGQLVAGYNKSRYEVEHAAVLQDVADRIDELLQPDQQAVMAA